MSTETVTTNLRIGGVAFLVGILTTIITVVALSARSNRASRIQWESEDGYGEFLGI